MWEFSNLNSYSSIWLPDAGQRQSSYPMFYPASANPYGCLFSGPESVPFPGFGAQGSFLQFKSTFLSPLNPPALNPVSKYSVPEAAATHQAKRFLVFDHSGDQTSLVFSSVANPFEGLNLALPGSNASYAHVSNNPVMSEDVHEDTEDIDALLYSDSEYLYDEEEASTGHSPLEVEEVAGSHIPSKRRRVDSTELDVSLTDTANSGIAPCSSCMPEADHIDPGLVHFIGIGEGKSGGDRRRCSKKERIKSTVSVLRRIIPGGKGKDTVSVLDEAIRYLKSLKVRAKALGATTLTL